MKPLIFLTFAVVARYSFLSGYEGYLCEGLELLYSLHVAVALELLRSG